MNNLLAFAIAAHGGLDRWNTFTKLTAKVGIGGAIWDLKQQSGLLADTVAEIDTHEQRLTFTPFRGDGRRSLLVPGCIAIETVEGSVIEENLNPMRMFDEHQVKTPWSPLHAAYFASQALWTYLTSPFLYAMPGFVCEEIEPWHENGEEWRRLKVTFPTSVERHTRTQITHFGPDGLMRRHDYTVDILGSATGANYMTAYREFQGIWMPTRRRVYARDDTGRKVPEPVLVSIDLQSVLFS